MRTLIHEQAGWLPLITAVTAGLLTINVCASDEWAEELSSLSLEELTSIQVTSVSKKKERLSVTDAAIYVITGEDIRRSGVATLPEALRMVPGLDVARINGNFWAISSRGFNGQLANKLLVLIDGRTIYTPLFSGVYWEFQDLVLEDVERIEVIRGPGGSLWGANAVNGIINIITKHSKDTPGGLISGGIATDNYGLHGLRYGGQIDADTHYRLFGKYLGKNTSFAKDETHDDGDFGTIGLRIDHEPSADLKFFLDAGFHNTEVGDNMIDTMPTFPGIRRLIDDRRYTGGHILTQWSGTIDAGSEWSLQLYYDYQDNDLIILNERRDTADLDFQYRFSLSERHEFLVGLGYRFTGDKLTKSDSDNFAFIPKSRDADTVSAFVQDDITLKPDTLRLTLGSKFEYNDYTGDEIQPTARLTWTPNEKNTVWMAVSRAVRTPARFEADADIDFFILDPMTFQINQLIIRGDDDVDSEELIAYEAGYRILLGSDVSLDVTAFYNDYDQLLTTNFVSPTVGVFDNNGDGETYGAEILVAWKPADWWLIESSYSFLQIQLHGALGPTEGDSPHHKVYTRSLIDLPGNFEFDSALRYLDTLPNQNNPAYFALDLRLGWQPNDAITFDIGAQNLLDNHHPEFGAGQFLSQITEVRPNYYARLTYKF